MPPRKQLGQILLESGVIDEFQLKSALGYQKKWGGRLGKVLVENRFITEQALVQAIHEQTGTPTTDLNSIDVPDYLIRLVPLDLASRHMLLPVRLEAEPGKGVETLFLAMADPTNLEALDEIRFRTGKRTRPLLAAESEIERAIRRVYLKEESPQEKQAEGVEVSLDEEMVVVQGHLEQSPPQAFGLMAGGEGGFADPFATLESMGSSQTTQPAPAPAATDPQPKAPAGPSAGELPEIELVEEVADLLEAPPAEVSPSAPPETAAPIGPSTFSTITPEAEAKPAPSGKSIEEILNRVGIEMPLPASPPPASPATAPPVKEIVRELDERIEQMLGRLESAQRDDELPQLMRPSHVVAALVRLLLRKEVVSVEELLEELKQQ